MIVVKRIAQLVVCLALAVVVSAGASAQINTSSCTSTAQCPDGFSCQAGFLGFKSCRFEFCNADSDCSRPGALCTLGICRLPAGGGGGSGGIARSGEGGRCGPQRLGGGVIKSIGCQRGLRCTNGFCQRLLQ